MTFIGCAIAILIALIPPHSTDPQPRESSEVEAKEVLRQVVAAYHSLSTYSDRGTGVDHMAGSDTVYTVNKRMNRSAHSRGRRPLPGAVARARLSLALDLRAGKLEQMLRLRMFSE